MPDAPPPVHPGPTAGGDGPVSEALLADFRAWLAAGGDPAPEPLDLAAVVREFTALRHDVQLQTKATRVAVEKLGAPPDVREVQRPLVEALLDVADALATAKDQLDRTREMFALYLDMPEFPPSRSVGFWGQFRGRTVTDPELHSWALEAYSGIQGAVDVLPPRLAAVADGYALSLRRVERALAAAGVEPIPALGERFDPQTMEAVELAVGGDAASGTVLAESRRGYRRHGVVFRYARVTVAR